MANATKPNMPDVSGQTGQFAALDWVGMSEIEVPIWWESSEGRLRQGARAGAFVSLDINPQRGIHMSRLYLILQEGLSRQSLSLPLMTELVGEFLKTHEGLSSSAKLEISFDLPVQRPALRSANKAWRLYPILFSVIRQGDQDLATMEVRVTYSSTCPASAALSRQLIRQNFEKQFEGKDASIAQISEWLGTTDGINATPHAQRSEARVKVQFDANKAMSPDQLIDLLEEALQTPVQAAVKREDEQEFALRNGQNLMFCEDAARRIKKALDQEASILDYVGEMTHFESLHPHNAVSRITKGKAGGLRGFGN